MDILSAPFMSYEPVRDNTDGAATVSTGKAAAKID